MTFPTRRRGVVWLLFLGASLLGAVTPVQAELRLASIFGDQMVLQRDQAVAVWGWAQPAESISVEFAGQTVTTTAAQDGRWQLELQPLEASRVERTLIVRGKETSLQLSGLLVGEVWIASGQSNMAMSARKTQEWKELQASTADPLLRLFLVAPSGVSPMKTLDECRGEWNLAIPATAGNITAAGYYFARRLREELDLPVGLIDSAWGGTCAEQWTSRMALESNPQTAPLWQAFQQRVDNFDPASATPKAEAARLLQEFREAKQAAFENKTRLPRPPRIVSSPLTKRYTPTNMYNTMIHPLIPFGIRGVVWYQGEGNRARAEQYETLLPVMIQDWRQRWGRTEMPFGIVQLANIKHPAEEPHESDWAEQQWAQFQVAKTVPHTGLAVINDGTDTSLHPREKQKVGDRLARWALAQVYGQEKVAYSGPLYREAKVEPGAIRVQFDHAEGLRSRDGKPLGGFQIAGKDRTWKWAQAKIDGASVVVSCETIAEPVAVRYAWAGNPASANLTNASGLPASLFKTDDWPGLSHGRLVPE